MYSYARSFQWSVAPEIHDTEREGKTGEVGEKGVAPPPGSFVL